MVINLKLNQPKDKMKHWIRFTIIELLVVIAIISILTTILLPALKRARGSVKDIKCRSNLKQVGVACTSYSGDWNGWMPMANDEDDNRWWKRLTNNGYVPELDTSTPKPTILKCPSGRALGEMPIGSSQFYGMNVYGFNSGTVESGHSKLWFSWKIMGNSVISSSQITNYTSTPPSKFIFFADSIDPNYFAANGSCYQSYMVGYDDQSISTRHNKKANVLFGDMHVNGNTVNQLLDLGYSPTYIYQTEY